jgi:hypothetical protein
MRCAHNPDLPMHLPVLGEDRFVCSCGGIGVCLLYADHGTLCGVVGAPGCGVGMIRR